jgi:hypothetical protein
MSLSFFPVIAGQQAITAPVTLVQDCLFAGDNLLARTVQSGRGSSQIRVALDPGRHAMRIAALHRDALQTQRHQLDFDFIHLEIPNQCSIFHNI